MDGGKPMRSGSALIRVIVTDVNDNFPVFTQSVYKVSVNENVPVNTTIITVTSTDMDEGVNGQVTYSFRKTSGNVHHTGTFSINPATGDIKIYDKLDFEVTQNYELSVQAKDGGGLVAHCKVLIEVIDENDNAPEISITSLSSPIPEDSSSGTIVALIKVSDEDSGINGEVDCKVINGEYFNLISSSASYYRIITVGPLDREEVSIYNITILATDRGSPPLSSRKDITLEVSDVNDNPPVFKKSMFFAYVPENNLPGASIYRIEAIDLDTGDNAKIIYSISNVDTDHPVTAYLSINIETGVLYAQRSFDYEQQNEFMLQVSARDNGSPSLSSNATLTIRIMDQNDNAPKILYPSPESDVSSIFEMVPFTSEPGSLISKVVAVDADAGHNALLCYHFFPISESPYFTISPHTGEIKTLRIFQEKDTLNHKLVVIVKDSGDPCLSSSVTMNLVIANNFQQVVPKFENKVPEEDQQSNLQLYLVVGLAIISLLFIITVLLLIISKYKKSKPLPMFGPLTSSLYPQLDPRMFSPSATGTLTLPYSYNVCVALDSTENDFTYMTPNQNVAVDNLIDADNSGLETETANDSLPTNTCIQVSYCKS
ncbi:hypothetical protein GDO81_021011, partial [Engystomops pustulosus]